MKLDLFESCRIFLKSVFFFNYFFFALGCSAAPCPEHSPQLQEKESPCFSARQAQGVLTGKEENGRGQTEETEGGTQKIIPHDGTDGPEEEEVQSQRNITGSVTPYF